MDSHGTRLTRGLQQFLASLVAPGLMFIAISTSADLAISGQVAGPEQRARLNSSAKGDIMSPSSITFGPESRLLKPLDSLQWTYQRDDADTIVHYKFSETELPITDHSWNGNNLTQSLYSAQVSFLQSAPLGMAASVKLSPTPTDPQPSLYAESVNPVSIPLGTNAVMSVVLRVNSPGVPPSTTDSNFAISAAAYKAAFYDLPSIELSQQYNYWEIWPLTLVSKWFNVSRTVISSDANTTEYYYPIWSGTADPRPTIPVDTWCQIVVIIDRSLAHPKLIINGSEKTGGSTISGNLTDVQQIDLFDPGNVGSFINASLSGPTDLGYSVQFAEFWISKGMTYQSHFYTAE